LSLNRALLLFVAIGTVCAFVVAVLYLRVEVRHGAVYGFSKTIDQDRALAVPGGYVTANYPNFNRLDLDLRAYNADATYDLTLHVRATNAEQDVRTIRFSVRGRDVFHRKGAFANPFFSVRFDPIAESTGATYYVWIERGPRNRDDVITVWSIKSYSRVNTSDVVSAMLHRANAAWDLGALRVALTVAACLLFAGAAVTLAALISGGTGAQTWADGGQGLRWREHSPDGIQ
jgi:hypothetical protein